MRWVPLAAVLAFLLPATAAACSCVPRWFIVQSELTNARNVVFVGSVDEMAAGSLPAGRTSFFQDRLLRFRPYLFLRGSSPTHPLEVWGDGSDCGMPFEVGHTYLVFARRSEDGKLAAEGCSSTGPLYLHGLIFGVLAVLLVAAGASAWGLWRLLRWLRRAAWLPSWIRGQGARSPGLKSHPKRDALRWLLASVGLVGFASLLWMMGPRLAPPVEVTVCNHGASESIEQVEAQLMPASQMHPPAQLGRLPPGECRTAQLPIRGADSVRLTYRVQGASFTVRDPALEYVEGGFHALTNVQGPGATESEMSPPYEELPALPVRILALSLLASVVGALAALLCAAGAAVRSLWGARKG